MGTCPYCQTSSRVDPDAFTFERVLVAKPLGTFSLSGLTAKGPTWRQRQDYLARVDHEATMRASMEQLERMWAQAPEEEA